jgi:hypothetical protein
MIQLLTGTIHDVVTDDLQKALLQDATAAKLWQSLTPLARNEWICWVISPKKQETRNEHVKRVVEELKQGMRRPCCWIGCIHRTDKDISPSVRSILERSSKLG